ncbi:hypothetical protein [Actinomycetospora aeridis]|uniref:Glycoside hydrolase family 42 N-terminal domain-containing protein n=1 Tax=Actinomycetospora aeridis TaxID=3129231 RepID=A0ABU8MYJ8_9PSEU
MLVAVVAAAVVLAVLVLGGASRATAPGDGEPPRFGVLGSSCDAARVGPLVGAGVSLAQITIRWSEFAPEPGIVDPGYRDEVDATIRRCRDAGLGVVLSPGLQGVPEWVTALPGASYRDQYGRPGSAAVPNLAFSAAARDATAEYLAEVARTWPLETFAAIRVGTGDNGELGYPTRSADPSGETPSNAFWAFDDAAQQGDGLAAGAAPSPMPGWTPGDPEWNGRAVDAKQVRSWFEWYSASIAGAARWQIDTLRELGFRGEIHLPLAGRGVLPADLDAAVENRLDGTGDRDGSLNTGLDYRAQLAALAAAPGPLVVDSSSVDDTTAVNARRLDPPQDVCAPDDAEQVRFPTVDVSAWPSYRWTAAVAAEHGLPVMGENPGNAAAAGTGGDAGSDPLPEQMTQGTRYAQECGFRAFLFAFEDDLFGGSPDLNPDVYAARIRAVTG